VREDATLRLAHLFSDHVVLQREAPVPVWGWTKPGLRVRVSLGSYSAETRATSEGRFLVRLPPMPAGGPFVMDVTTSDPAIHARVSDVMVGEVWLCSGQSNMEWMLKDTAFDVRDVSEADSCIRTFCVPRLALLGRQQDVNASWVVATPQAIPVFTAVGFFLARRLARELNVAVGVINASWGGTRIQAWMSREELVRHDWTRAEVARYEADVNGCSYWNQCAGMDPDSPMAVETLKRALYPKDPGNTGVLNQWAEAGFDDSAWKPVAVPGSWIRAGYDTNGVFWYRRAITIPSAWAGKDLTLSVGAVDKHDITYFNGEQVGAMGSGSDEGFWNVPRVYTVPGRLVKEGHAVVAVRASSFVHDGGLIGPAEKMTVCPADGSGTPIPLDGTWRLKMEHDYGRVSAIGLSFGPGNAHSPYILNDSMIQPLIPFALRGAAWYQGESNDAESRAYGSMLRAMIRDWRRAWGQGDFAFLTVQLANFRVPTAYDAAASWPYVREGQFASLTEPNTGLAVAIDIGDSVDIHPRNKQDVGSRLAQWALARTYGKAIVPSGPLYREFTIEGDRVRVRFDHVGGGLVARNGALKTFVVAGSNRAFVQAEAVIDGDTVLVCAKDVREPIAVRYAWADNPDGCNLYNREGLPASPFRTDCW
jgi:sialate O-acetylesterase